MGGMEESFTFIGRMVLIPNARMNMFPQIGCHVSVQVAETVKGAEGEMEAESSNQGEDAVHLLGGKEARARQTSNGFWHG